MLHRIGRIIQQSLSEQPRFPPTEIYCEGWLLRLVLDHLTRCPEPLPSLEVLPGSEWFSEARLPSRFLPRHRGDPLSEGWTHSDAVVGHFDIRDDAKAGIRLKDEARQFTVVEAKVFSSLSSGISNAPDYDQAARTVACMAEVVSRSGQDPAEIETLEFILMAPQEQIGLSKSLLEPSSIETKVARRVSMYEGDASHSDWFDNSFLPLLHRIRIRAVSWEALAAEFSAVDSEFGRGFWRFYRKTLEYN